MLSYLFNRSSTTHKPISEKDALKNFLTSSNEIKKMHKISENIKHSDSTLESGTQNYMEETLNAINNATTFSEILTLTNRFDFENTQDRSLKKMGRTGTVSLLFLMSFKDPEADFAYNFLYFRENAIKFMAENGFKADTAITVSNEN